LKITCDNVFADYRRWINDGGQYSSAVLPRLIKSMKADVDHAKSDGSGRWRPSLMGDGCDRKLTLSFLGEKSTFNGNWMAWSGTWLHLAFQTYLLDTYPAFVSIEHVVKPKARHIGVTGKADWVWNGVDHMDGMNRIRGPHVGDYKSAINLNKVGVEPREAHVKQLGNEMMTLGMDVGYLVYQNRTYGDICTWRLEAEPGDFLEMQQRLAYLGKSSRQGVLPPMLDGCVTQSGPTYKECEFKESCLARELGQTT
jgi:hypothetical protein